MTVEQYREELNKGTKFVHGSGQIALREGASATNNSDNFDQFSADSRIPAGAKIIASYCVGGGARCVFVGQTSECTGDARKYAAPVRWNEYVDVQTNETRVEVVWRIT